MKRPNKQLRAQALDTTQLARATGGRGTWCGAVIHCECGCVFSAGGSNVCPACGQEAFDNGDNNPNCPQDATCSLL